MEIVFAVCFILGLAVVCWIVNGPFCPKHIFTRMTRDAVTQIKNKNDPFGFGPETIYEVRWICPKCGEIVTKPEIVTEDKDR